MRTYVAIGDFLERLATKNTYDYVFIDVGPSSGALTRAFFLACDGFFIPVAPDRFNVQAISTLSHIIDRWTRDHQQVIEAYKELGFPIREGNPSFLGCIVQAFKKYSGVAKPGYQMWMDRIPVEIDEKLDEETHQVLLSLIDNCITNKNPSIAQKGLWLAGYSDVVYQTQSCPSRFTLFND